MHRFHGAVERFGVVAKYIFENYGRNISYIADVAGGQGMLTRILRKKYNYDAEVIDPRGWVMTGVSNRQEEFNSELALHYDLIVGLHPDAATRAVAEAAMLRPVILIPCCNYWDKSKKLGREALLAEISKFYSKHNIGFKRVEFDFDSSKNVGLVSTPLGTPLFPRIRNYK